MAEKEPDLEGRQFLEESGIASVAAEELLGTLGRLLDAQHQRSLDRSGEDETREGLLEWGRVYLKEHFTKSPSAMHQWLAEQLDRFDQKRGRKINLVGPRGGAKSTIGSLAYVLRCAVEGTEPYIWIVSDTVQQAQGHLKNVREELLENEPLAKTYPLSMGIGSVWQASRLVLKNGTMIEAIGTGQRIRGRRRRAHRPTLIVCDDLQNDDHMRSSRLRSQTERWFTGTLMKAGTKRTNVVNVATALHREALAMKLCETPGWVSKRFRSVIRWPFRNDLWRHWESLYCNPENLESPLVARAFYEESRQAMHEGAELLWPEEEDLYTLMCMRVEGGADRI